MTSIEELIRGLVTDGVTDALGPYLPRLARPECRSYTFGQAALVIGCSDRHVSKLVRDRVLPIVPHMGGRKLIPRVAVEAFVDGRAASASSHPEDAGDADVARLEAAS